MYESATKLPCDKVSVVKFPAILVSRPRYQDITYQLADINGCQYAMQKQSTVLYIVTLVTADGVILLISNYTS